MSNPGFSDPSLFNNVSMTTREINSQFGSTQELQPSKFYGIDIASFANSKFYRGGPSKVQKQPFNMLKAVAMNPKVPIEDRMRAVRYMDKIPHVNRLTGSLEAAKTIIDSEDCPVGEIFFFFSNNEKITKLNGDLAKACHHYFFTTGFDHPHWPFILRLLSASQIYTTELQYNPIWNQAREFIIKIAIDTNETVRIRAEAADILCRGVKPEDCSIGRQVISELGDLYIENKSSNIYTNAQNVHNEHITESVMAVIRSMLKKKTRRIFNEQKSKDEKKEEDESPIGFTSSANQTALIEQNSGHIADRLMILTKNFPRERRDKIFNAFNFILIHPAKYEGITPSDLLCLIWNEIQSQESGLKGELEQRLLQELYDMIATDGACATGIVSRLVNVLQGYIQEESLQIKMSIKDQLRANVFARLQANLKVLPEKEQDIILNELSEDGDKEFAREFVITYSVKSELENEFVAAGLIDKTAFDGIYTRCIADFIGVDESDAIELIKNDK